MAKLFIEDLALAGKRVLMRVDFNVPLKDGVIDDDKRIRAAIPSIKYALDKGASVVLMSHLGRPDGKVVEKYSLKPVAACLEKLLGKKVEFLTDCVGPAIEQRCAALKPGEVVLLENLRFHIEEEGKIKNKDGTSVKAEPAAVEAFRASLSKLGDVFVNDAFGTAHRAHSSMVGVNLQRASGYLLKKELDFLGDAIANPKKPFVAIIGGAKISGKIDVISALLPRVDKLIIGGGMAFTFHKARGYEIGISLCENDRVPLAKELLEKAGDKIVLPDDCVVTPTLDFGARTLGPTKVVKVTEIPVDEEGVDIGPITVEKFKAILKGAKTVLWNGPMGVCEIDETAKGTNAIATLLAEITATGSITIIGGGDSAAAIAKAGLEEKVTHVSTGGGASLEFLEGKELPGVTSLTDK